MPLASSSVNRESAADSGPSRPARAIVQHTNSLSCKWLGQYRRLWEDRLDNFEIELERRTSVLNAETMVLVIAATKAGMTAGAAMGWKSSLGRFAEQLP